MDILMITHFTQVPGEKGNGRFHYLANLLAEEGMNVEIITTQFSHRTKSMRNVTQQQLDELQYKLTMLKEPGYKKNVSLKRFYSHYIMGRSLKKYLKSRKKPDVIYCAVPSLDVASVASKYAEDNNIRFIIDVQDLWPEAFKMVFNVPIISDIIFKPMEFMANNIYRRADEIVAVSETYVNRALSINKKVDKGISVFLGTELTYFDKLAEENKVVKPEDEMWLTYIGTLGHSYDLGLVIEALSEVQKQGIHNLKFMVLGDGPLKHKFENQANELGINVEFTGRLDYAKMVGYLVASDIAINPIKKGTAASIINKVGDYAAAGLPVINTQQSEEYKALINTYKAGENIDSKEKLITELMKLQDNKTLRVEMGMNNRKLAEEKFNRSKTYDVIKNMIKN
ncbi:MAG: glycosyltransferase family 4 protein [Clostridiales bacterium]|nr:glycosyltransferase family 4 protein [Clostridiales bacterium]